MVGRVYSANYPGQLTNYFQTKYCNVAYDLNLKLTFSAYKITRTNKINEQGDKATAKKGEKPRKNCLDKMLFIPPMM